MRRWVSGIAWSWMAPAAVTTLFTDPGSYTAVTGKFWNTAVFGASANRFGSNHGYVAIA